MAIITCPKCGTECDPGHLVALALEMKRTLSDVHSVCPRCMTVVTIMIDKGTVASVKEGYFVGGSRIAGGS
jgi:NMD protein affecting ribosome stability and mRNA decay